MPLPLPMCLGLLVSKLCARVCVGLWSIPSCHDPHWAALTFVFCSCSAKELTLDSAFPVFFSAQMQVTIQHIAHPSRDTEVCCSPCQGELCPMKLTSQSLISAPKTLCNLPSPSLDKLLCPLPPSSPPVGWLFLVTLEDHGLLHPWGICFGMARHLKQPPFYKSFVHCTPFRTQFKIYALYDFIVPHFRPSDFSPSSPTQGIYDFSLDCADILQLFQKRASHLTI